MKQRNFYLFWQVFITNLIEKNNFELENFMVSDINESYRLIDVSRKIARVDY